ncbi:MAG: hypothetical protein BWY75_01543 [bacterium ADurb.Bin425]|nr:MAG: hypothetical protein BWY75_01543 [bacterium ADurb.Bin425]
MKKVAVYSGSPFPVATKPNDLTSADLVFFVGVEIDGQNLSGGR